MYMYTHKCSIHKHTVHVHCTAYQPALKYSVVKATGMPGRFYDWHPGFIPVSCTVVNAPSLQATETRSKHGP